MTFYSAFQWNAYQNNAYQIARAAPAQQGGDDGYIRRKRKPDLRVEIETEERLNFERSISEIYDRLNDLPLEEQREVAQIVTKSKAADVALPPLSTLDLTAVMRDLSDVRRLLDIRRKLALMDEEIAIVMLLAL